MSSHHPSEVSSAETRRASKSQPWTSILTVDIILRVLKNSIFHPYVTALIPLCLRAGDIPYSAPAFRNSVIYAIIIGCLWLLQPLNEWIAYGRRRKVNHDDEVVVITGGASGLGRCLAEIYYLKGTAVAILDVKDPHGSRGAGKRVQSAREKGGEDGNQDELDNMDESIAYFPCDISSPAAVQRAWSSIVDTLGTPTVLINNAGVVNAKPFLDLTPEEVATTLSTNTSSHFHLTSLFLHSLIASRQPGTLVTISSILGRLGAANLSTYTASKAALIAYHASLTAELHQQGHDSYIKTLLVTPGQLSTEMFADVHLNAVQKFFGPVLEVQELALKIVKTIRDGKGGVIAEPAYARWIGVLDVMPVGVARWLRDLAGVDTAMDGIAKGGK